MMGVSNVLAQDDYYWPDADYDSSIPTFEEVLGYAPGEEVSWHRDTMKYFDALQAAAPDQVLITEYAESWQGRETHLRCYLFA